MTRKRVRKVPGCSAKGGVVERRVLCRKCGQRERPAYHDWCGTCHAAWRRGREAAKREADPERRAWVRTWNTLKMRQYRGHVMREEPCRICQAEKATLMLLKRSPLTWTVLCKPCRLRHFPHRDVTGRPTRKPPRTESLVLHREVRTLGL
jgi:hypothetical protein